MADIFEFQQDKDSYMDMAEKALSRGDIPFAVLFCKKCLEISKKDRRAHLCLAKIYESLDEREFAVKMYMRIMSEDDPAVLLKTTACLIAMGQVSAATHYGKMLIKLIDKYDHYASAFEELDDEEMESLIDIFEMYNSETYGVDVDEFDDEYDDDEFDELDDSPFSDKAKKARFWLAKDKFGRLPNLSEEAQILGLANECIINEQYRAALPLLEGISEDSVFKEKADDMIVGIYAALSDYDKVIAEGERVLAHRESDTIAAMVAGAYLYQDRLEEADVILRKIIEKGPERVSFLKPIFGIYASSGNDKMTANLFRYVLEIKPLSLLPMVYLSQSLFNLGEKDEALAIMKRVQSVYGKLFPAEYYIDYFTEQTEGLECSSGLPTFEVLERERKLSKMARSALKSDKKAKELAMRLKYDLELRELLEWGLRSESMETCADALETIEAIHTSAAGAILAEALADTEVYFRMTPELLCAYVRKWGAYRGTVVYDYVWQRVTVVYPPVLEKLPWVFMNAYFDLFEVCFQAGENISIWAEKIARMIDKVAELEKGELVIKAPGGNKIFKLRSVGALMALLVYKITGDPMADIADEFETTLATVKKYNEILFGDK